MRVFANFIRMENTFLFDKNILKSRTIILKNVRELLSKYGEMTFGTEAQGIEVSSDNSK